MESFIESNYWQAKNILSSLEAWNRTPEDHRAETPARFLKMLHQMTTREEFKFTTFPAQSDEMVVLSPIPFYTFCAHHIVPFYGDVHIGYIPEGRIAGLSKFARAVKYMAKGFWVQEELTTDLAQYIEEQLDPQGVAVVVQAEHLCMAMRGVQQPGVITTTSAMRGVFANHDRTAKAEFMDLIKGGLK